MKEGNLGSQRHQVAVIQVSGAGSREDDKEGVDLRDDKDQDPLDLMLGCLYGKEWRGCGCWLAFLVDDDDIP